MIRFVPRQRKHKVRAREENGSHGVSSPSSTNQEQIIPLSKSEREAKKQQLRQKLRAQQNVVSSKKRKRLDKYIETKLKKDENLGLLKKLEAEQAKANGKLIGLQSSKTLGKQTLHAHATELAPAKHWRASEDHGEDSAFESEDSFEEAQKEAFPESDQDISHAEFFSSHETTTIGSGLAKPMIIGEDGLPIIATRYSKKKRKREEDWGVAEELPWEGFDSEPEQNGTESDLEEDQQIIEGLEHQKQDTSNAEDDHGSFMDEDSDMSTSDTSQEDADKPKESAFRSWATQQLNKALDHVPSYELVASQMALNTSPPNPKNQVINPVAAWKSVAGEQGIKQTTHSVLVKRSESIQQSRAELPVTQKEQEIMEAIRNNPVVIIKGDTGSGKTTQIPQFLYEAGYGSPDTPNPGLVGVTQPRRVAAVSMARRVADELGPHGDKASYQIRFDSTVSPKTAIKFMTDGILLRELSQDLLLKKYSVIVIDEAHERSVNTDILVGMLSKIVPARMRKTRFNLNPTPLKLIIMSATLNIGDFLNDKLFLPEDKPPIVEIEGRQHHITTHFALRSRSDYVEEVIEKVRRAHRKLPRGGILVFLTGQNEIRLVRDRLRKLLASPKEPNGSNDNSMVTFAASDAPLELDDIDFGNSEPQTANDDFEVDILTRSEDEEESDEFEISDDEDGQDTVEQTQPSAQPFQDPYDSVHVLPLYSQLPTKDQLFVFEPPPPRSRLIVLATNVAETSLTIPGIRFVFDTGRSKERKYDTETSVQTFEVDYISKASAQQRSGRAGRTGAGHCWRLYSSAVYEQFFPEHAAPEILQTPAESIVLQLKGFAYPKPVVEFPFPTPPATQTLKKAEKLLQNLGALDASGAITGLGRELSVYPLSPRLGKVLSLGVKEAKLLFDVVAVVAGLTVSEIFVNESQIDMRPTQLKEEEVYSQEHQQEDDEREKRRQAFGRSRALMSGQDKTSDISKLLTAVTMYGAAIDKEQSCKDNFLNPKGMAEVAQLRHQLMSIVKANNRTILDPSDTRGAKQTKRLNFIVASGYIDQVAIRADLAPNPPAVLNKPNRAIDVPYLPLISLADHLSASLVEKAVFIHPSSVLSRLQVKDLPQYIIYSHLQQSQTRIIGSEKAPKTRMFPLTPIDAPKLAQLAHDTVLIEYGKPLPKTKVESLPGTPKRRECWVATELRGGPGFGWPLPPTKVRQVMDAKSSTGWRVEEVIS